MRLFIFSFVTFVTCVLRACASLSGDVSALCHDGASCNAMVDLLPQLPLPSTVNADVLQEMVASLVHSRERAPDGGWYSDKLAGFSDVDKTWCPNASYYEFLPVQMGTPLFPNVAQTWSGSCFASTSATLTLSATGGTVTFTASNPTGLCDDLYLFVTAYKMRIFDLSALSAGRAFVIDTWEANELAYIQTFGLASLILPCGLIGTITSAVNTIELFVSSDLLDINAQFLQQRGVYPPMTAFNQHQVVDPSLVKSGDYLAIARFDGLDPMIMFGTGGRTGHSAVCVWDNGTLFVVESTDANPFGAVYWPPPYGIIRTEYTLWIERALNASYMVALLPISPVYSEKFDEQSFWSYFATVAGQPYGYHTFMYCFLDTSPMANLPQPIVSSSFTWVLTALDRLLGNAGKVNMETIFTAGINKRLNLSCNSMECVSDHLTPLNLTLAQVTATPELDAWRYDNSTNTSMTCSMFAMSVWQHGFKEMAPFNAIQANEQTPKDNYQMALFDPNFFTAANCPIGLTTTPAGTYCQLMGPFHLPLNGYNTLAPYAGMNNHCSSQWPGYMRGPTNC